MKGDIVRGPTGFVTYDKLFELMNGDGVPTRLSEEEKSIFVNRLSGLDPNIAPHYGVAEDCLGSAVVREARTLDAGRTYVRYEVSCRRSDWTWDGPYQMLVIWSPEGTADAYTFIHETGRGTRVAATLYTASCDRSEYTSDVSHAIGFSLAMEDGDAIVVGNDDCDGEFICVTSEKGAARLAWQAFGSPYWFNSVSTVSWPEAVHAVRVFQTAGVRAAQNLCEWEVAEPYDTNTGDMTFHIPLILRRELAKAIRTGDKDLVDMIHKCGISVDGLLPEADVSCPYRPAGC